MKTFGALFGAFLISLALVAGGCQSAGPVNAAKDKPTGVVILFGKPPKPYVVVGEVSALKSQPLPGETWQDALQKEAAARGADAVLVDTTSLDNSKTMSVSGIAIRYK